jgi:hypothetical protein
MFAHGGTAKQFLLGEFILFLQSWITPKRRTHPSAGSKPAAHQPALRLAGEAVGQHGAPPANPGRIEVVVGRFDLQPTLPQTIGEQNDGIHQIAGRVEGMQAAGLL